MSDRIAWLYTPSLVESSFRDAFGSHVDAGSIGVSLGGAIVEGTPAERERALEIVTSSMRKSGLFGKGSE